MGIISYAQNFEDVLLWRALGHIKGGCYIDIGAHHPIVDSVSKAFYDHGWRGIHVEPLPGYCDALRRDRPDETILQAAVAAQPGVLHFYEIPDTGISTASKAIATSHRERGYTVNEITVPSVTLAQVFELAQNGTVHWLKIDVEGLEAEVLGGWGESLVRPWIVVVESTLPLTQEEVFFSWENYLTTRDYRWIFFDGLNRYYLAAEHSDLENEFRSGANVFDDFQLYGVASNSFCKFVENKLQVESENQIALLQEQLKHREATEASLVENLASSNTRLEGFQQALQMEQMSNLQNQKDAGALVLEAERETRRRVELLQSEFRATEKQLQEKLKFAEEQADNQKLKLLESERTHARQLNREKDRQLQLQQDFGNRERLLQERCFLIEGELHQQGEIHLQEAMAREQVHSSQLLAGKEQLSQFHREARAREQFLQNELTHAGQRARQEIEVLIRQAGEREQEFSAQLLATKEELRFLQQEHNTREQVLREQLEQTQRAAGEVAAAYLQNALEREHLVAIQVQQLQDRASELQLFYEARDEAWSREEKSLRQENANLVQDMGQLRRDLQAQVQLHALALESHAMDRQHLIEGHVALQAQLQREIVAGHEAHLALQERLAELQSRLMTMRSSLSWRLTAPLRAIWYCISGRGDDAMPTAILSDSGISRPGVAVCPAVIPADTVQTEYPASLPSVAEVAIELNELNLNKPIMTSINHAQDLLKLTGERFVRALYATLLGREPDPDGLAFYLSRLRRGYGRHHVLADIANSAEARSKAIDLPGLKEVLRDCSANKSWWQRLPAMLNQHEMSLNRIEELIDTVREDALHAEQRLSSRLDKLESMIGGLQSGITQAPNAAQRDQLGLLSEEGSSCHDAGQQSNLWLQRIQSLTRQK